MGFVLGMRDSLDVLYEDNHIIVVIKPCNVLSQGDFTGDIDMLTLIKQYIKEKYDKKGNVYLGLVHRLDRPTSGIMVFAKTSKASSRLCKQITDGLFTKKYLAVLMGKLDKKEGSLENYIKKVDNYSVITNKEDGKYALLSYKVLKEIDNLSLVDVLLHTGRHHQIRVQFKNINHPLYGDQRYGIENKKQLALCAYHLEFFHPVTKEKLVFERFPSGGIWDIFK